MEEKGAARMEMRRSTFTTPQWIFWDDKGFRCSSRLSEHLIILFRFS